MTTIQRQRLTIQIQPLFLKIPPRLTRVGSVRILSQHWPCLPGYEDGESWWNHVIEQGSDDDPELFDALAQAMAELRSAMPNDSLREAQREAFMRLQIAEAAKTKRGSNRCGLRCLASAGAEDQG